MTTVAADLQDLIDSLRRDGFAIGIGEHLRVQQVAAAWKQARPDVRQEGLKTWLAPVVCHTANEQARFYARFEEWCAARVQSIETPGADEPRRRGHEVGYRGSWRIVSVVAAAVVALLPTLGPVVANREAPAPSTAQAPPPPPDSTVTDVTVPAPATSPRIQYAAVGGDLGQVETHEVSGRVEDMAGNGVSGVALRLFPSRALSFELEWTVARGHSAGISSVEFSPDGERLATASDDYTARLWDARTGKPLAEPLKHERPVNSVQFSPDGTRVVTASSDKTARLWDAGTGEPLAEPLKHENTVWSAQFSPDGTRVATASDDGTARLWDARTGEPLAEPLKHKDWVLSAQFSPDGTRVVTASDDYTARLWDARTGEPLAEPLKHEGPVWSAQFSPDGTRVVTASRDNSARLWDAHTGEPLAAPLKHEDWVLSAQFSPDGTRVVTASDDYTARLWDARTGKPLAEPLKHEGPVWSAQFSPDGTRVVTASDDHTARLWDARTGEPLAEPLKHEDWVRSAQFSPDGTRVATVTSDGALHLARVEPADLVSRTIVFEDRQRRVDRREGAVNQAVFDPDGTRIVTACRDGIARIWHANDGARKPILLTGHTGEVTGADFSPDGTYVVTASRDSTARIWRTDGTGEPVVLRGHEDVVRYAHFDSRGDWVVTASDDGTVRVWRSDEPDNPTTIPQRRGEIRSAFFHQDTVRVVTSERDDRNTIFSTDATIVATRDKDETVQVRWADGSGKSALLKGHVGRVNSVALSPDGSRIVTASNDWTARVWWADGVGTPLILQGHRAGVNSAAFSPDGASVVTASDDGTARRWFLNRAVTDSTGAFRLAFPTSHGEQRIRLQHAGVSDTSAFVAPATAGRTTVQATLGRSGPAGSHWILRHRAAVLFWLLAAPIVGFVVWLGASRSRRPLALERRTTVSVPATVRMWFATPGQGDLGGPPLGRLLTSLRRHRAVASMDLDAEASINATLGRGGLFTPVYRARPVLPAYLVLVDRTGFTDQRAQLIEDLLDQLRRGHIAIDRYHFDGDPRRCESGKGDFRELRDLAGVHPDHRLLLFTDGQGMTDPLGGPPPAWLETFSTWDERALLTSAPPDQWQAREWQFERSGFRVVPATATGLQLFVDALAVPERRLPADIAPTPRLPELLADRPTRWIESIAPDAATEAALLAELRAYLGPLGYRWLCALAVYPELNWHLTIYLGARLAAAASAPLDEKLLLTLTRLPWLRYGTIPDWLRLDLVGTLSSTDEGVIRGALEGLLLAATQEPAGLFSLEIVPSARALSSKRARRRWLLRFLQSDAATGSLRDHVFVSFLLRRKPGRLQVSAPKTWHRMLYRHGVRWFGLRPLPAMVLALTLSTLGAVAWSGFARRVEDQTPWVSTIEEVWDLRSGRLVTRLNQGGTPPRAALFCGASPYFLVVDGRGEARLYHGWDGHSIGPLRGGNIALAAASADGRTLVTVDSAGTAIVWWLERRTQLGRFAWEPMPAALAVSANGRLVVTGEAGGIVRVRDLRSGAQVSVGQQEIVPPFDVSFTPGADFSCIRPVENGRYSLLDVATGERRWSPGYDVAFDRTGRLAVNWGREVILEDSPDPPENARTLRAPDRAQLVSLAMTPDGERLLGTVSGGGALLWDTTDTTGFANPRRLKTRDYFTKAFAARDRLFVTLSSDGAVRLWGARRGDPIARLDHRAEDMTSSPVVDLSLNDPGSRLLTRTQDGSVWLWNCEPPVDRPGTPWLWRADSPMDTVQTQPIPTSSARVRENRLREEKGKLLNK